MQPYCEIVDVAPLLLAVTQRGVPRSDIAQLIHGPFDVVYTRLRHALVQRAGHNHAMHHRCTARTRRLQIGFPVTGSFADTEPVKCFERASGRAVHATHAGAYSQMHPTYDALHAWSSQRRLRLTGESWEVSDDWSDDPSKLLTDLYLRVESA